MRTERGSEVTTADYWELLVVFGLAFLTVVLLSGFVTGPSPTLQLVSGLVGLSVAFVATVGYDRIFAGNSVRRSRFWTVIKSFYPVTFGVYVLALGVRVVLGGLPIRPALVIVIAALLGVGAAVVSVQRDEQASSPSGP